MVVKTMVVLCIIIIITVVYYFQKINFVCLSEELYLQQNLPTWYKNNPRQDCKWPPESNEQLLNPKTKRYDLTLRPCLEEDAESVDPCTTDYYKQLLNLYRGPSLSNKSCLRQLVEMDEHVRMNHREPNYSLYPQMGNIRDLVSAIKEGRSVRNPPINDPYLGIVHHPPNVCDGNSSAHSLDLVVLIKTCIDCSSQRMRARNTYMQRHLWGEFRVRFAFVVGLPGSKQSEWMHFEGVRVRNPTKVFQDAQAVKTSLLNESEHYRDMIVGDFIDSYYNLTLKQMTTFRWVSAFCRYTSPIYFFIDNDYSIVPRNLIKLIQYIPDKIKLQLNGGTFGPLRTVFRPKNPNNAGRWDVSLDEVPWTNYPQYSSGAAYIIGASLVTDAAIAMAYTKFLRIDDAYLGFVWDKLHVPVLAIPGMDHTAVNSPTREDVISIPFREADEMVDWRTGKFWPKIVETKIND